MDIEVYRGHTRFKALERTWRDLEGRCETATVFQTWDWCDCWLSHFKGVEPLIIVVADEGRVLSIVPLAVSRFWWGLPIRRATFIGTGPGDYGGWLESHSDERIYGQLAKALGSLGVDLFDLHQLPESAAAAIKKPLSEKLDVALIPQEPTFSAALPRNFSDYLATLSKKFRKNTQYADRRLTRDFRFERRSQEEAADQRRAMDIFYRLHQQRWLSKRLPGMFAGRKNRRFHTDLARRLAESGRLVLALGCVEDEPAAALYGFKFNRSYSYYLGGFDPKWAKYSVSTVLIYNLIRAACEEGFTDFDFLRGAEPYKLNWRAEPTHLYRLIAHPPTRRGVVAAKMALVENAAVQRFRARLHS